MLRWINWQGAREMFQESTWITIVWEWLQKLLGRAVDLVLWITMIYSGYQLIPGAPQASAGVSSFMFIAQFVALDVGGLGLNQLGQQQGLDRWAYSRVVAYILIGITLITITYSGIHHAFEFTTLQGKIENHIPDAVNTGIEVFLVVVRAVMTVFYGQAIKSLKVVEHTTRDRLAQLEAEAPELRNQVSTLQQQLSSVQQNLSTVQRQLDGSKQEVSTLRQQLDAEQQRASTLQEELETGHGDTAGLRRELNAAKIQVETLQAQLDGKKLELAGLRETLEDGQEWQSSRVRALLEAEQERAANLQRLLTDEQNVTVALRREKNAAVVEADRLRGQLDAKEREVERVQEVLNSEQQTVSTLKQSLEAEQRRLSTVQQEASTLREKLSSVQVSSIQSVQASSGQTRKMDSGQATQKVDGGQGKVLELDTSRRRKNGQDDSAIAEQIRELLDKEPGLSGRKIAERLGCSPTTAAKWKSFFENGGQTEAVNE